MLTTQNSCKEVPKILKRDKRGIDLEWSDKTKNTNVLSDMLYYLFLNLKRSEPWRNILLNFRYSIINYPANFLDFHFDKES